GRAGGRTLEDVRSVASAVADSQNLLLVGLESFEGIIHEGEPAATLEAVDRFMGAFRAAVIDFDEAGFFSRAQEVVLSAGGSAFFGRGVAGLRGPLRLSTPGASLLRPGRYLTPSALPHSPPA